MDVVPETLASLRKANQELRHAVQTLRDQLQVETQRADLSAKAAQDAWQFARVALKTGRSTMNGS